MISQRLIQISTVWILLQSFLGKVKGEQNNNTSSTPKTKPCDHQPSTRYQVLSICSFSILCVGIIGNSITIVVIQKSRYLRKRIAYVFVRSLAVADLGVSIFVTTVKVGNYWKDGSFCYGFPFCVFSHFTDTLFPIASISHLLIIGVDRWYAATFPYAYISNTSGQKAQFVIFIGWTYSLVWAIMGFFSWDQPNMLAYKLDEMGGHLYCYSLNKYYHTSIILFVYVLPMTFVTILNAVVLRIAVKQASEISRTGSFRKNVRKRRFQSDVKAIKTVLSVILTYTICWLPHIIIVMLLYWTPAVLNDFRQNFELAYDIVTTIFSNILPTVSSCINPFIYFIVGREFGNASKDLYRKLTGRSRYSFNENSRCESEAVNFNRKISAGNW